MTQPSFDLQDAIWQEPEPVTALTYRDRCASLFQAHPGVWLHWTQFAANCGALAWRSRISECRTQLGMRIENRIEHELSGIRHSYYRWVK